MEMSDPVQSQTNVIKIKKEPPPGVGVTEVTEGNNTVDITGDADSSNIRDPTVIMIKTEDKLPESGSSNATKPADEGNVQTADAQTAQTSTSDTRPDEQQASAKTRKMKQEEERQKLQLLVSHFSENQLNHYEMYRRAAFPKAAIKRLMQSVAGATISQNVVIAMSGIAKVYVGEIVEEALEVKSRFGEHGPLQPKHIREAVRILRQSNAIPNTKYKKHSRLT